MTKPVFDGSIWFRPHPGERAGRLTRNTISAAALSIADTEGFEAVSMRRVADHLGASTMSLYHYVRTKRELVALMDDALMGEVLVPEGQLPRQWREAISTIARQTRVVFARHTWALSMHGAPPGPNALRHFEQSLEALEEAPMSVESKLTLLQLVDDFVFGHSLRAAEVSARVDDIKPSKSAEALDKQLFATGDYPHTAKLLKKASSRGTVEIREWLTRDRFEGALMTVLDGAERRLVLAPRGNATSRQK
jgi:AcrR family transcriptional regulator